MWPKKILPMSIADGNESFLNLAGAPTLIFYSYGGGLKNSWGRNSKRHQGQTRLLGDSRNAAAPIVISAGRQKWPSRYEGQKTRTLISLHPGIMKMYPERNFGASAPSSQNAGGSAGGTASHYARIGNSRAFMSFAQQLKR